MFLSKRVHVLLASFSFAMSVLGAVLGAVLVSSLSFDVCLWLPLVTWECFLRDTSVYLQAYCPVNLFLGHLCPLTLCHV